MRKSPDNSMALAAYIAHKAEIDAILGRLTDDVTWAHVGTLGGYLDGLRRVGDGAVHEGEDAG